MARPHGAPDRRERAALAQPEMRDKHVIPIDAGASATRDDPARPGYHDFAGFNSIVRG